MSLIPVTAEEADLTPTSGAVTIVDGVGSFTVSAVEDHLTEGSETFRGLLRTGSVAGEVVAVSGIVTITDTSLTVPTYALEHDGESVAVNEGSSTRWNVATTNVPDGTTLYWTILDVTTEGAADFTAASGSCVVTSNASFIDVSPVTDSLLEGNEYFRVQLRTGSASGTVVATAGDIYGGDFRVDDTTSGTQPTFPSRPTTIIEAEGNYYIGLQGNPDTGFSYFGFYIFNKTTGVITNTYASTRADGGDTSAMVYLEGSLYWANGTATSGGGIHRNRLDGSADTVVLDGGQTNSPVGLATDGTYLYTLKLQYYSWPTPQQGIVKLDQNLNTIATRDVGTLVGLSSRYPEGKNVYVDNGIVWATCVDDSVIYRLPIDMSSHVRLSIYATHLAFSSDYVFASGGNAVKKLDKSGNLLATYALIGCRHILYIPELNKLAITTPSNTISYMNVDGSIDNVVALPSGFTDPRQSIYSGGVLLTACYSGDKINNLYNP